MKGYKNYLKEVVGPHHTDRKPEFESTNIQSLFDMQGRTIGSRAELNLQKKIEPPHDKTNKMICAPSKDSNQPGHPSSLISLSCAL